MSPEQIKTKVPSYKIVEEKIKQIDRTIMIFRIFFIPVESIYRFQLMKRDRMCTVELHKTLLDTLKNGDTTAEEELAEILLISIDNDEFWTDIQ